MKNNDIFQFYSQNTLEQPNDEIWYWADSKAELYNGAGVRTHTFENGKGIIKYYTALSKIPRLFKNYSTPTRVSLPDGPTTGDQYMLYAQQQLTQVRLPSTFVTIPSEAFNLDIALVACPIPESVLVINNSAFREIQSLIIDKLPSNLSSIGTSAFINCRNIKISQLADSLITIGNSAFEGCRLVDISSIPQRVTVLNSRVFHTTGIRNITLHSGITDIKQYAFYTCSNLSSVVFLGTPSSIATRVFENDTNLRDIYVPWAEGEVANAPWGASSAIIHYNS